MLPLLLLGCAASGWIDAEPTCEHGVDTWWEDDPAWMLRRAEEDGEGNWQFEAPSSFGRIDVREGFWDPGDGVFAYSERWADAPAYLRTDLSYTGSVSRGGDHDLVGEGLSYDDAGVRYAWAATSRREGCVTTTTAQVRDAPEVTTRVSTAVDPDTIAHESSYGAEGEAPLEIASGTETSDGVWRRRLERLDGSYEEDAVRWPSGETDLSWADHSAADRGWERWGEERIWLDWHRSGIEWQAEGGDLYRTCLYAVSFEGEGTATCEEDDRICLLAWDTTSCSETCDGGASLPC